MPTQDHTSHYTKIHGGKAYNALSLDEELYTNNRCWGRENQFSSGMNLILSGNP